MSKIRDHEDLPSGRAWAVKSTRVAFRREIRESLRIRKYIFEAVLRRRGGHGCRPGFCGEALTPGAQLSSDSRRDNLIDLLVRLSSYVVMHDGACVGRWT